MRSHWVLCQSRVRGRKIQKNNFRKKKFPLELKISNQLNQWNHCKRFKVLPVTKKNQQSSRKSWKYLHMTFNNLSDRDLRASNNPLLTRQDMVGLNNIRKFLMKYRNFLVRLMNSMLSKSLKKLSIF